MKTDKINAVNYEVIDNPIEFKVPYMIKQRFNVRFQWKRDFENISDTHLRTLLEDVKNETDLDKINGLIERNFPKK